MSKLTLTDVSDFRNGLVTATVINNNSAAIEQAFENTLSRDGTSPNTMGSDLDMNSNDIINVGEIEVDTLILNGTSITGPDDLIGPTGPNLNLFRDSSSPAVSDILGKVLFNGRDSASNVQEYASIETVIADPTSTSEDGVLDFYATKAGARTRVLTLNPGGASLQNCGVYTVDANLRPVTNDVGALGQSSYGWSDLFLASGAVINFDAGDVTITHSANALNFSGATGGYHFDNALIGLKTSVDTNHGFIYNGTVDGPESRGFAGFTWKTGSSGATERMRLDSAGKLSLPTSGSVIDFNSGDVTLTHSSNLLSVAGGDLSAPLYRSTADFTLADDTATSIDCAALGFGSDYHTAILTNRSGIASGGYGIFMFRVTTSPAAGSLAIGSNVNLTNSLALTGTTSTDGKLNISPHTDGKLYIENRLGGSNKFSITFF